MTKKYKDFGEFMEEMERVLERIPPEKRKIFNNVQELIDYYKKVKSK